MLSQTVRVVDPRLSIDHEGCCRPEQLSSVGGPPHWRPASRIFLMASVGLERDFLVLFGELKFAWRQVKGIWCRGYYCLVILDGSVQCQLLRNRAPSPRFLSPYLLGLPLVISPEWGLDWHILRKLPWEILLHLATSEFEPQTLTTHHLYCKSLQY